jgi:hypothetical protein
MEELDSLYHKWIQNHCKRGDIRPTHWIIHPRDYNRIIQAVHDSGRLVNSASGYTYCGCLFMLSTAQDGVRLALILD